MEHVLIRAMSHADVDAVLLLDREWEQEDIAHGDFNQVSREAFIANLERFQPYFLVAESDGAVVGYINASVQLDKRVEVLPEREPYVEIENIYVKPEFRNSDVGGKLIERLFEVAGQQGIERFLVSSVSKEMDRILKFYRSHGFTPWYIQLFK
jgi:ribosomal protein S18 acetylase RimI-like enzyme